MMKLHIFGLLTCGGYIFVYMYLKLMQDNELSRIEPRNELSRIEPRNQHLGLLGVKTKWE